MNLYVAKSTLESKPSKNLVELTVYEVIGMLLMTLLFFIAA